MRQPLLKRGSLDHVKGRLLILDILILGLDLDHMGQAGTAVEVLQQLLDGLVLSLRLSLDLWKPLMSNRGPHDGEVNGRLEGDLGR